MKNYFDFIMYLAFRTILIYENKRSLTVEQLHDYRKKLCEKHIEYHSQFSEYDDEEFEKNLHFFHSANINMTLAEEGQNLIDFINDNDEYFFYKDGVISLRDEVSYEELEDANFELDSYTYRDDKIICGELSGMCECVECLDILDATKIKEFVYKIIEDEKKIERAYQTYSEFELEQNIKKLLVSTNYKLALIGNLTDDKMRCYDRTIGSLGNVDTVSKGKDVRLLSDYLMENDKFYNLSPESIDSVITDKYQRAIFNNGTLVYDRLNSKMDAIWSYREPDCQIEVEPVDPDAASLLMEERMEELDSFEDEFEDDDVEVDFDEYDEEDDMDQVDFYLYRKRIDMAFYLNYIDHINKFSEMYGSNESLESAKCRLLYLLDGYGDNLFKEENFRENLNNVSMSEINYKQDLDDFYTLSRLFLIDISEGWIDDDATLKKMLFISTYYDLTKDKRIKRIVNKYQKSELGEKISDILLEGDYSKLTSDIVSPTKTLTKKKTDINDNQ